MNKLTTEEKLKRITFYNNFLVPIIDIGGNSFIKGKEYIVVDRFRESLYILNEEKQKIYFTMSFVNSYFKVPSDDRKHGLLYNSYKKQIL